jgi:ribosomal-protein-alanine N-acetyltransferase
MSELDLDEVVGIEQVAYPCPWTRGIFEDCLRVGYACWVLEQAGAIVAYGVLSVAVGEAHILNLCVRPERQRQGHGRSLLRHLLGLARRHHADTALLEVRPSNRAALALYQRLGFNEVGMRRGYYPGERGREDALILAIDLAGGGQGPGGER